MSKLSLGFVVLSVVAGANGAIAQQQCGPACQTCVQQLGVPRDGAGKPVWARVDRVAFRECIGRQRPEGSSGYGRTGGNRRRG